MSITGNEMPKKGQIHVWGNCSLWLWPYGQTSMMQFLHWR